MSNIAPESEGGAQPTLFPESFLHPTIYEPIPFDGTEGFSDVAIAAISAINDAFEHVEPGDVPTVDGKVIAQFLISIAKQLSGPEYDYILAHGVTMHSDDKKRDEPAPQEARSKLRDIAPQVINVAIPPAEESEHTCGCAQCNLGYHCHNTSRGCTL